MKEAKTSIFTLSFINIVIVAVTDQMAQHAMNTLVPKYANLLGVSASLVGFIGSAFALTALAMRPISGPSIDFLNKKHLLTAALTVKVAAFIMFSRSGSAGVLLAARLIHGIGTGFSAPLLLAMASECLPEGKKASGIGFYSLAQVLAMSVGPATGIYLSEKIGYSSTFLGGAGVMCIACFLAAIMPNKYDKSLRKKFHVGFGNIIAKEAITPSVITLLMALTYSSVNYFVAIYGAERQVADVALFFTAYAITLLFTRPFSGIIVDRFGATVAVIPAHIMYAAAFCVISVSKSLPMFILSGVLMACGYGTLYTILQHLCMSSVPGERVGAAANTNYTFMDIGFLLGGLFSGFVHDQAFAVTGDSLSAYEVMYRVMIIPVAISLTIYLLSRKKALRVSADKLKP